jgi:hypothetical protein
MSKTNLTLLLALAVVVTVIVGQVAANPYVPPP